MVLLSQCDVASCTTRWSIIVRHKGHLDYAVRCSHACVCCPRCKLVVDKRRKVAWPVTNDRHKSIITTRLPLDNSQSPKGTTMYIENVVQGQYYYAGRPIYMQRAMHHHASHALSHTQPTHYLLCLIASPHPSGKAATTKSTKAGELLGPMPPSLRARQGE